MDGHKDRNPRPDRATLDLEPAERILLLRMGGPPHALRLSSIAGVAECGRVHPVPDAPAPVHGVVEWQGNLVTVLDLPRLLRVDVTDGPACLIRLAPPLEHIALRVPGRLRMTSLTAPSTPGAEPGDRDGVRLIDPPHLLRDLLAIRPSQG
jgi:hypothetical protein